MKIAEVILDIQSNQFSKPFRYLIVDESVQSKDILDNHKSLCEQVEFKDKEKFNTEIGSTVVVPFGKQFKLAFVIDIYQSNNAENLKPVLFAASQKLFTKENVSLAKYISKKYLASLASCIRLFIPAGAAAKLSHKNNFWQASVHNFRIKDDSFIEKYLSDVLADNKNWKDFVLTEGQNDALTYINNCVSKNLHKVVVLDGVTGSGKTEVYLRAISNVLDKGKNAIVLVPEISLTPQTVSRFYNRFGNNIAVMHSKISASERANQINKIRSGNVRLVIGARSAIFCPLENIGLVVIDEEHENSYKQDKTPRYKTVDCAEYLAKQNDAVLVLGSATPSLESIYNCQTKDDWQLIKLPQRTNNAQMPKIDIVDMGLEFKNGSKNLFSKQLENSICQQLKAGHKVLLFHNRRGFANYMFCRSCGYTPKCSNCSTTLTYHQRLIVDGSPKQMLFCHHCGHLEHVPITCPQCNSPYIAKYGAGTQSVEEQLEALIADNEITDARVVRMDADTTNQALGHQKCLEEFAKSGPAILLGTQMIAKGLDFDDVTLVGVVLIDTNLSLPDFRCAERTFNLILQVAGRAGRANLAGKVIVQTYNPQDTSIVCAANYEKDNFIAQEFAKRKLMNYPPYSSLVNFIISGAKEEIVVEYSNQVQDCLESYIQKNNLSEWDLLPSAPCVLSKIRNQFRYHILLKSNAENVSAHIEKALKNLKIKSNVKLNIDVDPVSLF